MNPKILESNLKEFWLCEVGHPVVVVCYRLHMEREQPWISSTETCLFDSLLKRGVQFICSSEYLNLQTHMNYYSQIWGIM